MAFRRRFGGFQPRSFGRKTSRQVPRWTAQSADQLLTAAAPASTLTLYNPGTTVGAGAYEEEALLVRIVGRLCVVPDTATALSGPVGLGICKTQNGSNPTVGGSYDPLISTELTARDWLGVYNFQMPPNAGANGFQYMKELDIRVKRRLKAEDLIALKMINGVGDDITVTIDIRILIVIRL